MSIPHRYSPAPALSIVIPTWNERLRLPETLSAISQFASSSPWTIEVIIADDGSTDDTASVVRASACITDVRVVRLCQHRGPGAASRAGVLAARGRRILLCDADAPVPIDQVCRLWDAIDNGADIAVGSRVLGGDSVLVRQPPHRILMGKFWRALVGRAVPTGVLDTQCGFKLFSSEAAKRIFCNLQSTGFVFHVEALVRARTQGFNVQEIPVDWRDRPGSRVRIVADPINMLKELRALRDDRARPHA